MKLFNAELFMNFLSYIPQNWELSCEPVFDTRGIRHQIVPPALFPSEGTPDTGIQWSEGI